MMESLNRILAQRGLVGKEESSHQDVASQRTLKSTFKCDICRDTTFVLGDNGRYKHCSCVEKRRIETLWENFGVKLEDIKKLSSYKPVDERTLELKNKAKEYILNFDEKKGSFGILGQSGVGKSHVSIAIGGALISRGHKVVYMPYIEGIRELKCNVLEEEYYNRLQRRFSRADVLIIDDLFKDKLIGGRV
ncbi:MAG: ATP-binding protein, partial [Clostridium sp.]